MVSKEQAEARIAYFEQGDFLLIQNEINNIEYIIKMQRNTDLTSS